MRRVALSVEDLRKRYSYDPDTGNIVSLIATPTRKAGYIAGHKSYDKTGCVYTGIRYYGRLLLAHRVAWALHTGEWPSLSVDHIDGNGQNNKWENLRLVTPIQNGQNMCMNSRNKTGIMGVMWHKQLQKWHAAIRINNQFKHLGVSDSFFEACCLRKSAEHHAGFTLRHGCEKRRPSP